MESEAKAKRESISSLFYEYEQPDIEPFIAPISDDRKRRGMPFIPNNGIYPRPP